MPGFLLFLMTVWEAAVGTSQPPPIMPRPARRARLALRSRVLPADACTPPHTPTLDIFFTVLIFLRSRTGLGKKAREAVVRTTQALERSEGPAASFPRPPRADSAGPGRWKQALDRDWTIWAGLDAKGRRKDRQYAMVCSFSFLDAEQARRSCGDPWAMMSQLGCPRCIGVWDLMGHGPNGCPGVQERSDT